MTDINQVTIVGRLTKDLGADSRDFAYLPNGQARANVSIAVNRSRKQGDQWVDEVNFFDVTIWGKTAENLKPYLTKGKQIAISGSLKQDRWEKDGNKFSRVIINADTVQLLGGRSDGGQQSGGYTPRFQDNGAQNQQPPVMRDSYGENNQGFNNGPSFGGSDGSFPEDVPF